MLLIYDLMLVDVFSGLFTFFYGRDLLNRSCSLGHWSCLLVSCFVAEKELEGGWRIK